MQVWFESNPAAHDQRFWLPIESALRAGDLLLVDLGFTKFEIFAGVTRMGWSSLPEEHHVLIKTVPKSCIQDRTLYEDPEIFAKYLHGLGFMDNRELNLYFEHSRRFDRDLLRPDLILMLSVDLLFHLSASVPKKYGIPIGQLNGQKLDIRSAEGKTVFCTRVEAALRELTLL